MSTARTTVIAGLAAAALAVLAIILIGGRGESPYRVRVEMRNADGLRQGSTVRFGGVQVGTVKSIGLGRGDIVVADLELNPDVTPIGRGPRAAIRSANLLGEKYLEIERGDRSHPLPSPVVIPASRTSAPVDLDEVLDILDPGTRARLQILVNETGAALTGRSVDFNALLDRLPSSLDATRDLLAAVAADNRALGRLVTRSDAFLASAAVKRAELGRFVVAGSGALHAVAAREGDLGRTVADAPAALASLRSWLGRLGTTAGALGPAARSITATAPALTTTLAALGPFERAARPVLDDLGATAPALAQLGRQGAPVARRAVPAIASLAHVAQDARPLSRALDASIDDALGTVEGWSRSIQGRDGLGHMFRGHATISIDLIRSALSRLALLERPRARKPAAGPDLPVEIAPAMPAPAKQLLDGVSDLPSKLGESVKRALDPVTKVAGSAAPPAGRDVSKTSRLLDYLLGR